MDTAIAFAADAANVNRPNATTPVKVHVLVKVDAVTKLGDPTTKNKVATKTINLVRPEPADDAVNDAEGCFYHESGADQPSWWCDVRGRYRNGSFPSEDRADGDATQWSGSS